jgi:hypothetical protein
MQQQFQGPRPIDAISSTAPASLAEFPMKEQSVKLGELHWQMGSK